MQFVGVIAVDAALGFVPHQQHRPAAASQRLRDLFVERGEPVADVDHEHADIRLGDRHPRVLLRRPGQRGDISRRILRHGHVEPGGVDEGEALAAPLHDAVEAVASQARQLVDDRASCAGQTIEQRRLADVRPSNDGDDSDGGRNRIRLLAPAPVRRAGGTHLSPPGTGVMSRPICGMGPPSAASANAFMSSAPDCVVRQMMYT